MRHTGLKQQVKAGELTACQAIDRLEREAYNEGTLRILKRTRTWNWLNKKIK